MIFSIDTFSFLLHFVFAALGYFVHTVGYVGGICMFAFFNQTTRNLLKAIASNWLDIVLTLVLIFIIAYIYSIVTYYYFFNQFDFETWFSIQSKPCRSMYTCYANHLNFGIRMGGGIGEVLKPVPENQSYFEGHWFLELSFFFLINSLGLNMLFGIIIDSFGNLREKEWDIENDLNNNCLVCSLTKTEFETKGLISTITCHLSTTSKTT